MTKDTSAGSAGRGDAFLPRWYKDGWTWRAHVVVGWHMSDPALLGGASIRVYDYACGRTGGDSHAIELGRSPMFYTPCRSCVRVVRARRLDLDTL